MSGYAETSLSFKFLSSVLRCGCSNNSSLDSEGSEARAEKRFSLDWRKIESRIQAHNIRYSPRSLLLGTRVAELIGTGPVSPPLDLKTSTPLFESV